MTPAGGIGAGSVAARRPAVLFLTQVLPYPLDSGPKVRAYHVLRSVAEWADVTLVSFVRDDDPASALAHLRKVCSEVRAVPMRRSRLADGWHLARALLTGSSFVIARDTTRAMQRCLQQLAADRRFNAVHADQLWMAQYARDLPIAFKVLDNHNAVYRIFQRLAANETGWLRRRLMEREWRRLADYETAQVESFDHVFFVTDDDRTAVMSVANAEQRELMTTRTSVVPICVDVSAQDRVAVCADAHRITVLGTMYWPPNIEGVLWFAEHVLEQVLSAAPDAVFTVIGKRPPPAVLALEQRFGKALEVTGYVADVTPYLEETAVFAVPLLSGGGMRVKILDAWAWGVPVVSTTVGAEGINVRPGVDALVVDEPADFAAAVVTLLRDPLRRAEICQAARLQLAEFYDVRRVYEVLGEVYAPVL